MATIGPPNNAPSPMPYTRAQEDLAQQQRAIMRLGFWLFGLGVFIMIAAVALVAGSIFILKMGVGEVTPIFTAVSSVVAGIGGGGGFFATAHKLFKMSQERMDVRLKLEEENRRTIP